MIEFENVSKAYGNLVVADSVTMVVPARTITAIVGTSGSGKSTLMRMVNRLIEPSHGVIRIDGEDISGVSPYELRRRIGYVIQNHGLFPHYTIFENIATVPNLLGWQRQRVKRRVEELLDLFHLEPGIYAKRYPHELSGGQQQRVGVARALAAEPNILLMDEPFGALDPIIRAKANKNLLQIQKTFSTTILLVTHDIEEAIQLGDQIAVMDKGKILQHASPKDLLFHPASDFVEELVGTGAKAYRLLSLKKLKDLVAEGEADGAPLSAEMNLKEALSDLLWRKCDQLPVADENGHIIGRIFLKDILKFAAGPLPC